MKMGGKRKVVETIEEGNGEEDEEGVEERKNKWRIKKIEKSSRIGEQKDKISSFSFLLQTDSLVRFFTSAFYQNVLEGQMTYVQNDF